MPNIFVKTEDEMTDMVIDCTKFKFQHATNLALNSLMFSDYKSTLTGKSLTGTSTHKTGLLFKDVFPGSISDSSSTENKVFLIGLIQNMN